MKAKKSLDVTKGTENSNVQLRSTSERTKWSSVDEDMTEEG